MLNQVIIVGRLVDEVKTIETEEGRKVSYITLAVSRPYKNVDGIYETDFINCTLWDGIAENTAEYCNKGDVIGVRGRLQSEIVKEDDEVRNKINVVAERITFLSNKKNDEVENGKETSEEA